MSWLFYQFDRKLACWARRKYKKLRHHRQRSSIAPKSDPVMLPATVTKPASAPVRSASRHSLDDEDRPSQRTRGTTLEAPSADIVPDPLIIGLSSRRRRILSMGMLSVGAISRVNSWHPVQGAASTPRAEHFPPFARRENFRLPTFHPRLQSAETQAWNCCGRPPRASPDKPAASCGSPWSWPRRKSSTVCRMIG